MSRSIGLLLVVASLYCAVAASAEVETWQIDPVHSSAQFSVRHLGISTVRGAFSKVSGTVKYDATDPRKGAVDAAIEAASLDTRVTMRDDDLRGADFFDVAKFPNITFKSKRIEAAGAGKLKITGDLTIHGVTNEVVLAVDGPSAVVKGESDERRGVLATTKINRKDFGVSGASAMVGDEITITIDVELTRPLAAK